MSYCNQIQSSSQEEENREEEARKERRRAELREQIRNVENEIDDYNNQISDLDSKLQQQRSMKAYFETKCDDLANEKRAKRTCAEKIEAYTENLRFAKGYLGAMDDLLEGTTAQSYATCQQEMNDCMQTEIDKNQSILEGLIETRDGKYKELEKLNNELDSI